MDKILQWFGCFIEGIRKLLTGVKQESGNPADKQEPPFTEAAIPEPAEWVSRGDKRIEIEEKRVQPQRPSADTSERTKNGRVRVSAETERRFRSEPHTSVKAYRLPILQVLVNLGGSARRKDVFDELEKMMADQLTENDRKTLPSNPRLTRWQRIAANSRNGLLKDGYLTAVPEEGLWVITDTGRVFLRDDQNQTSQNRFPV